MWNWLSENWATIVVSIVFFGLLIAIAIKLIKDKKQGKSSCGCACKGCAMCGKCHGGCGGTTVHTQGDSSDTIDTPPTPPSAKQ